MTERRWEDVTLCASGAQPASTGGDVYLQCSKSIGRAPRHYWMLPGDALCDDWTYLIKHFEVYNVVCVLVCNIDAVNPDVDGTDAVSLDIIPFNNK